MNDTEPGKQRRTGEAARADVPALSRRTADGAIVGERVCCPGKRQASSW
ncbi:MAG TPA: hypothetical protein VGF67_03725 [Ktedonobacteraceae bacterium]